MAIIFTQDGDILPGGEDEYERFISEEYIPRCDKLGLKSVGGFYVEVGFDPRDIQEMLENQDFRCVTNKLCCNYVVNYASRIMRTTERFDEPKWFRL